jgi:hypothetical protein
MACPYSVVFDTVDNSPPPERPPLIVIEHSSQTNRQAVLGIAIVGALIIVFVFAMIAANMTHGLVKSIQPLLVYVVLVGELFAVARALLILSPPTDAVCKAEILVGHLAVFCAFVALYVKTWRVNALMIMSTLKKIKITNEDALKMTGLGIAGLCVYLIITAAVGDSHRAYSETDIANQLTDTYYCEETYPAIQYSLYVVEAVLLIAVLNYTWSIRSLPGAVNESHPILGGIKTV